MLHNIYIVCLVVGVLYSIVTTLTNGLLDAVDIDLDFDLDAGIAFLPLKPFTIMIFATVFGGVGLIAEQFMPMVFTPIPAAALGLVVSKSLYHLLYVKLRQYETETAKEEDVLMTRAEVVETIQPGGYGKISFVIDGNTISGAAMETAPGGGIKKGHRVYIVAIQDNVYQVCEDLELYLTRKR